MGNARKKNDFKESRAAEAIASPLGKGLSAAAVTGGTLIALRRLLRTKAIAKRLPGMFKGRRGGIRGLSNKDAARASAFSGAFGALFAGPDKSTYAANLNKKLREGGKFTSAERKYILKGIGTKKKRKGSKTTISDIYWTPSKWGAASSAMGAIGSSFSEKRRLETAREMQRKSPGMAFTPRKALAAGILSFPSMWAEGKLRKHIQTRALSSRLSRGQDLLPAERKLLQTIRGIKDRRRAGTNA